VHANIIFLATSLQFHLLGETMKHVSAIFTLFLCSAIACSSDKGDDPDSDGTSDGSDGTSDSDFLPLEGSWESGEDQITENTCGDFELDESEETAENTIITISHSSGGFTMSTEDATFNCTLNNQNFTCAEEISENDLAEIGGGTLTVNYLFSGQFSSENAGRVEFESDTTCEGEGCATIALFGVSFPCVVDGSFAIGFAE